MNNETMSINKEKVNEKVANKAEMSDAEKIAIEQEAVNTLNEVIGDVSAVTPDQVDKIKKDPEKSRKVGNVIQRLVGAGLITAGGILIGTGIGIVGGGAALFAGLAVFGSSLDKRN